MKNLLLVLLSIGLLQSCKVKTGSGHIEKQNRNVSAFTGVSAGGGFEVEVRNGSTSKVTIEADDNILEDIETEVSGGKLNIRYRNGVSIRDASVKVFVETPELTYVDASAASSIKVEGVLKSGKPVHLEGSSAGSVTAEVDAPEVTLETSSSGKVVVKGRTQHVSTEASSGSSIEAGELLSENAKADVSSGASIELHASVKLDADASSGGSVKYRGNPAVTKKESSGGSVSN